MTDEIPPWLATMREITGTAEAPGSADNPTIMGWARYIGERFPDMASYAALYQHDGIAWCGLTVGYCMAKAGIRPVFGDGDLNRFLWADAWSRWGRTLDKPKLGCVMVFTRNGGGHVAMYEGENATHYLIRGGNQADAVNVMQMPKHQFTAAVWPVDAPKVEKPAKPAKKRPVTADMRRRMARAIVDFEARRIDGRLAVYNLPANDGGGAFEVAGINVRYHPEQAQTLRSMILKGQHDKAEAYVEEYILSYTDLVKDWTDDAGAEFFLRDCAFNRGPRGAARILQRAVGVPDDGEVGPQTLGATAAIAPDVLINKLRAAREGYELAVAGYRANFWNGLVNRWNHAADKAREFQKEQASLPPAVTNTLKTIPAIVAGWSLWDWVAAHPFYSVAAVVAIAAVGAWVWGRYATWRDRRPERPVAPVTAVHEEKGTS